MDMGRAILEWWPGAGAASAGGRRAFASAVAEQPEDTAVGA